MTSIENKKRWLVFILILAIILISTASSTISAIQKSSQDIMPEISSNQEINSQQQETIQSINKYNINDLPTSFTLKLGEEFYLDIDPENNKYKFSDNTDLFNINKETGEIRFTPQEVEEYNVVIIALENVKNFNYKLIKLKVINE
ncbi:MAG: hypothetical protein ABIH25_02170 [Candidatus Woesearchaeota archaeon]